MIRHVLSLLITGAVVLAGLVVAQEPPAREDQEPPLRLKKKKRDGQPPAGEPGKSDKEKEPEKAKGKEPEKAKAKEDEPIIPEDGPPDPDEDEKEVLERIGRNMRSVEEKLGNRELGDPTAQQQRDILRDIDALIRRSQNQQNQGGGNADQQPQGGEQNDQDRQAGSRSQQRRMARNSGSRQQRQMRGSRAQRPGQQKQGDSKMAGQQRDEGNAQAKADGAGNNPGAGGRGPENAKDLNADLYKDVWGHLPESLRAEMNAYSNPRPFMPRYDDLIRKYYRTIAEQGRKKGD